MLIKLRLILRLYKALFSEDDVAVLMVYHPESKELELDTHNTTPDGAANLMELSIKNIRGNQNILNYYSSKSIHLN